MLNAAEKNVLENGIAISQKRVRGAVGIDMALALSHKFDEACREGEPVPAWAFSLRALAGAYERTKQIIKQYKGERTPITDAKDRPIELRDYDAKEVVGVQIGTLGHKLWVCIDGVAVLRVYAPSIDFTDQRLPQNEETTPDNNQNEDQPSPAVLFQRGLDKF